jgi:hypothetical protein
MAEWSFDNLAEELERTASQLRETGDRNLRRKLLLQMRLLLSEADLLTEAEVLAESSDQSRSTQ